MATAPMEMDPLSVTGLKTSRLASILTGSEPGALKAEPLTMVVFSLCIMVALGGWLFGIAEDRLRVPLLLGGVAAIVLTVIKRENAAVAFLAVLIVGVLVAPRDYLLRIAHMIARPDAAFEEYAKRYEGEAADPAAISKLVTERVAEALQKQGVTVNASVRKAIGEIVTDTEADRIVARVRTEAANFPLRQIQSGGAALSELVSQHRSQTYFQEDMAFLRSEGLVTFAGTEYENAKLTPLGEQIARRLEASDGVNSARSSSLREVQNRPPAESEMQQLSLGESKKVPLTPEARTWLRFEIKNEGIFVLEANAVDKDTSITLFDGRREEIGADDDGGKDLNPRLERSLKPGKYFLAVEEVLDLGSSPSQVNVTLRRASRSSP